MKNTLSSLLTFRLIPMNYTTKMQAFDSPPSISRFLPFFSLCCGNFSRASFPRVSFLKVNSRRYKFFNKLIHIQVNINMCYLIIRLFYLFNMYLTWANWSRWIHFSGRWKWRHLSQLPIVHCSLLAHCFV